MPLTHNIMDANICYQIDAILIHDIGIIITWRIIWNWLPDTVTLCIIYYDYAMEINNNYLRNKLRLYRKHTSYYKPSFLTFRQYSKHFGIEQLDCQCWLHCYIRAKYAMQNIVCSMTSVISSWLTISNY